MNIESLLKFAVQQGASDIHLQPGSAPLLRIHGHMRGVESPAVTESDLDRLLTLLEIDTSLLSAHSPLHSSVGQIAELGRFRVRLVHAAHQRAASLRVIPSVVPTLDSLGLPAVLGDVARSFRGLSLVAGCAGSGLTTTLAAMVEQVNQTAPAHVVLVEAAPEHRMVPAKAIITRLQVDSDALSYASAIDTASRLDPDLLLVDEIADAEAARRFVQAAQKGIPVLGAIRANSVLDALLSLGNLVGSGGLRAIGDVLDAVFAQRLVSNRENKRQPVVEILRGTPLVRRSFVENRLNDVASFMAGRESGMQTFDQHLVELYQAKVISGTEAMRNATNVESVGLSLRGVVR